MAVLAIGCLVLGLEACGGDDDAVPTEGPQTETVALTDTVAAADATPTATVAATGGGRALTSTVRLAEERRGLDGCAAAAFPAEQLGTLPLNAGQIEAMVPGLKALTADLGAVSEELAAEVDTGAATVKLVATDRPRIALATTRALVGPLCQRAVAVMADATALDVWCCEPTLLGTDSVVALALPKALGEARGEVLTRRARQDGRVVLRLQAGSEQLGDRLDEQFGELLEIRVGHLPYPLVDDGDPAVSVCGTIGTGLPVADLGLDVVSAEVSPPADPGLDRLLTVTLRNSGRQPVTFVNPHVTSTTGPGRSVQLGAPTGRLPADTAIEDTLAAGEERIITAPVGTASCVPILGHTLPPGDYEAVFFMTVGTATAEIRTPFTV